MTTLTEGQASAILKNNSSQNPGVRELGPLILFDLQAMMHRGFRNGANEGFTGPLPSHALILRRASARILFLGAPPIMPTRPTMIARSPPQALTPIAGRGIIQQSALLPENELEQIHTVASGTTLEPSTNSFAEVNSGALDDTNGKN